MLFERRNFHGRGQAARRLRVFATTVTRGEVQRGLASRVSSIFSVKYYRGSANHSDSSGIARSLALSFSRVAAARRIPVLPHVFQRNSGFLARARHARGNDRKISTERTCVSLSRAGLNNS